MFVPLGTKAGPIILGPKVKNINETSLYLKKKTHFGGKTWTGYYKN